MNSAAFLGTRDPRTLIAIGLICTGYGIYLIKRGIEGDTLMPGTTFTYLPKWLFITTGLLLQLPLPAAFLILDQLKNLSAPAAFLFQTAADNFSTPT